MPGQGLLLTKDLFFGSKVSGTAAALGGMVDLAFSQPAAVARLAGGSYKIVIVDLQTPGLDLSNLCLAAGDIPVVAFGPHVATEAFTAAAAAGCREVLPHSRFSAQLPQLLREWLVLG